MDCRIFFLISLVYLTFGQKHKELLPKPGTLYASSLFRRNQVLDGVPEIENFTQISSVSTCLLYCLKNKPDCKSFNWGNGECTLLIDSICANETLFLTRKIGYSYYDIMDSPEFEVILQT